jgi:hypothetical protein
VPYSGQTAVMPIGVVHARALIRRLSMVWMRLFMVNLLARTIPHTIPFTRRAFPATAQR